MRRKEREVTDFAVVCRILEACETLRIGLADGAIPYIVPMNFGYEHAEDRLVFYVHGACNGRKLKLMRKNGVCAFEADCARGIEINPQRGEATTRYASVMGKARIEFLQGAQKEHGLHVLMERYPETRGMTIDARMAAHTMVARLTVTEWSAKANLSFL